MTNDARSKLRSMGGIMASSPELMQVAQKFQAGGPVMRMPSTGPTGPNFNPRMLMDQTVMGRGLVPSAPSVPPLAGTIPVVPREMLGDARRRALAGTAPSFGMEMGVGLGSLNPILEDDISVDDLLEASVEQDTGEGWVMPGGTAKGKTPQWLQDAVDKSLRKTEIAGYKEPSAEETIKTPMGGPRRGSAGPTRSVIDRNVGSLEGPEATGLGGQMRPTPPSPEEETPTPRPGTQADEPDQAMVDAETDIEDVGAAALSSLDKSYEDKLALFNKVFGDADSDKAEDRRMTLATIGLAIAAGQSPDALTNIAQGALAGLGAAGKRREARKAKGEKVKVMALDAALKEHAAQQEFARELGLKTLELGNKSQHRDTPTVRQAGGFGDVEVFLPIPEAAQQGISPVLADYKDFDKKYKQSLESRQKVFDTVDRAEQLINEYDIGGFGGAMERFKQDFSAAIPSFLKEAVGFDGSGEPTPQQEYDTLMRAMAAQFTPIILGESGRTISDGDRQRVAQILGFAVDNTTGKIGQYTGTAVTSEAELTSALREVRSILGSNYSEMDRTYQRYRPEQYQDIMESRKEKDSPSRITFDASGRRTQ